VFLSCVHFGDSNWCPFILTFNFRNRTNYLGESSGLQVGCREDGVYFFVRNVWMESTICKGVSWWRTPNVFPPKHQLFLSHAFSLIAKNGQVELLNYCLAPRYKLSLNQMMVLVSTITHGWIENSGRIWTIYWTTHNHHAITMWFLKGGCAHNPTTSWTAITKMVPNVWLSHDNIPERKFLCSEKI